MNENQQQRNKIQDGGDDGFAKALERQHELLMKSGRESAAGKNSTDSSQADPRLDSARAVLELLEDVCLLHETGNLADSATHPKHSADSSRSESHFPVHAELRQLGRFRIVEQIGRGGFGIVLRAFDPVLNRDVAIKIPRLQSFLAGESRLRFEREAQAAAALNHPGIVSVFETGSCDGVDFLVTELVEGENLTTLLARGEKFSPRAAAELVANLADALEHAHQRGVLHRDLKPSNVLVPEGKRRQHPLLADFGLASILDQADLTQSGAVVGTPAYMSPEQALGNRNAFSAATDVYGLGSILYELLTGSSPYCGLPHTKMLRAIVERDPVEPRKLNAGVPKDLNSICMKCLEKNPAARYSTCRELQADLQRFLDNCAVSARHISGAGRSLRWARRNPVVATLSMALVAGIVAALATVTLLWTGSEAHRRRAETNEARYLQKSEQLSDAIGRLFRNLANSPEIMSHSADGLRRTLLTEVSRFEADFLAESPDDPQLKLDYALSLKSLAEINLVLGDIDNSIQLVTAAIDQISQIDSDELPDSGQVVPFWILLAQAHARIGDVDHAEAAFDQALKLVGDITPEAGDDFQQWTQTEMTQMAMIMTRRAEALVFAEDIEKASGFAQTAMGLWRFMSNDPASFAIPMEHYDFEIGRSQFVLGETLRLSGKLSDAETVYRNAADSFGKVAEFTGSSIGLSYQWGRCYRSLGIVLAKQGQPEEAGEFYRSALEILDPIAAEHPLLERHVGLASQIRYSLAVAEMVGGNHSKALELIEQNIAEKKRIVGDFPELQATTYSSLGDALNVLYVILDSRGEDADSHLEQILLESIDSFEKSLEVDPDWDRPAMALSRVESNLAKVYYQMGNRELSRQWYEQAHQRILGIVFQKPDWEEATNALGAITFGLVGCCMGQEDHDAAIDFLVLLEQTIPDHPRVASARLGKPGLLAKAGRFAEAREAIDQFVEQHARKPDHFLDIAIRSMNISRLPTSRIDEESSADFEDLAVKLLLMGLPENESAREVYFQKIADHEDLADLADRIR